MQGRFTPSPVRREPVCRAGERCEANYCGGCTAVCQKPLPSATNSTTNNNTTHNSIATNSTTGGACSDGSTPVNCIVDPCISATCLAGEVCEADYCGGCNTICKKPAPSPWVPAPTSCADGSEFMRCFVDPCEAKQCAEGEQCVRNYCVGCNAVCKKPDASGSLPSTNGADVSGACADGSQPDNNCLVDPCSMDRCGYGLRCVSNCCGGCTAECKP